SPGRANSATDRPAHRGPTVAALSRRTPLRHEGNRLMTTVASAPQHGVLLRSMFYACADAIQGPAEPNAAAELARRVLRHIAMTIDELVNGHEADTVAGHAQLAAEYANTLAHTALPAA